jgi:hypothetical protein
MSDPLTPPTPPPSAPQNPIPKKSKATEILLGAAFGVGPGLLVLLMKKSDAIILPSLVCITLWPLLAIILSIVPASRRFGLGMLLGVGFGFMVMLSVCGGMNMNGFH